VQNFSWTGLRQFHNIGITASAHARLHRLSPNDSNVKKQASQIRDCLAQAKEYYDASEVVTLATQPVMMYYCALSLATAEILMKNDEDLSLDRARYNHNHHGLNFKTSLNKGNISDLNISAANLRAVPSIRKGARNNLERLALSSSGTAVRVSTPYRGT
jgi:YaaC-like Protein